MIRIQTELFSTEEESSRLIQHNPKIGGIVTFVGIVRDFTETAGVTALILEHYPGMTELELEKVEQAARAQFAVEALLVIHRVGRLAVGEPIVLVLAAASHRADAFLACRFVIDHLKRQATFWKKEVLQSGEERWIHNCPGCDSQAGQWNPPQSGHQTEPGPPSPAANPHQPSSSGHTVRWTGLQVGILTLSDSRSLATDQSGAALEQMVKDFGAEGVVRSILPDDRLTIQNLLSQWAREKRLDLILTTGGTGPGPRDCTPEATRAVCDRELPGFAELIRAAGLQQTRNAIFTRGVAAFCGNTLIINLPGSTRGATHSLEAIADLVPHALRMANGGGHS
ncbi:MAG: molybdenum cofactor biosynthesis protein MoaE [Magnetococcales bacterium]|nr:molybdenum cofactor biosynthesis protein MoaE [Magnetococcales bacterium]